MSTEPQRFQKGHARMTSEDRRVQVPRRSTKGPLELGEPPGATPSTPSDPMPAPRSPAPTPVPKDLSFLLTPSTFHTLPPSPLPAAFLARAPPSATPTPSELLRAHHYRAAAISAATTLTTTPHLTAAQIFALWHIRLLALSLLGAQFTVTAAQEVKVFSDLGSSFYRDESGESIVPWGLRVLAVRLAAVGAGDWRRALGAYYELAGEARRKVLAGGGEEGVEVWRRRLRELGVRVASALVELGDWEGAVEQLKGLEGGGERERGLVYVACGMVGRAKGVMGEGAALGLVAEGEWEEAGVQWRREGDGGLERNNEAVCKLYEGKLQEARELLESMVEDGVVFPGMVFNLATIYELCGDTAKTLKTELTEKVAAQGKEMTNAVFKL